MGLYRQDGSRITKSAFPTAALDDPPVRVTEDVYMSEPYGRGDGQPEGSKRYLLYPTGTIIKRSLLDHLFIAATITSIAPANGPAAGGTTVTITGTDLDGVESVVFGKATGTNLRIRSATELSVQTPPNGAGAVIVELVDDGGAVSKAGAFTYSAPPEPEEADG
ncbi:IPT/TIG domain-containing protein [Streptomyces sp. NPDC090442]|uniref:IPT/TIG domain-containing protein n=1 Tax=Streptomyces sp. NPDC090442 TaxID=3365962 RepID=UPI0037F4DFB5